MIERPLEQIDKDVIQDLIDREVVESKTLEYKRDLPGKGNDDKKEFLADVTSFANASGGDIIYGIEENSESGKNTGKPVSIYGISGETADEAMGRLQNMIRDSIDPRLVPDVRIKAVSGFEGEKEVLVLRISKSWSAPNMVKMGNSRFFARTSAGKYALDAGEIRFAFQQSDGLSDRLRNHHKEQVARIMSGEYAVPLPEGPKIIFSLFPGDSFDSKPAVNLRTIEQEYTELIPGDWDSSNFRINIDGLLIYEQRRDISHVQRYVQIYRNAMIEIVDSCVKDPYEDYVVASFISNRIIEQLNACTRFYRKHDIAPPLIIMVSLIEAKKLPMLFSRFGPDRFAHVFDREFLPLPDIVLEDLNSLKDVSFKPILDGLWQASGVHECSLFDEEGDFFTR